MTLPVFTHRLRELLRARRLSGYQLAKDSGVSKQTVSKLLRGKASPSWDTVVALAEALQVPTDAFRLPPADLA